MIGAVWVRGPRKFSAVSTGAPTPTPIEISTADGGMPALLWRPGGGVGPGLVLVQEIFGLSRYVRDRAADLAALGYVVCAPEVFWRLDDHEIDEDGPQVLDRAVSVAQRIDWPLAVADVGAALRWLRTDDGVVGGCGLIGFCFGGGLAFNVAAVDEPDVLISYYGSALPGLLELADQVSAPSLHHFGLADSYIRLDAVRTIERAVTAYGAEFATYPGAGHAFDNPDPAFYHPQASAEAWQRTTRFLAAHLPPE